MEKSKIEDRQSFTKTGGMVKQESILKFYCSICGKKSKYFGGCNKRHREKVSKIIICVIVTAQIIKILKKAGRIK